MQSNITYAKQSAAALALLVFAGTVPVYAADAIIDEPPAPSAPYEEMATTVWTGPYAGITLGYGFSGRTREPGNTINTDGFLGGAFAGYNYEFGGGLVGGVEGDVGYSGVKGDNAGTESKAGVEGSLRARLGYAVTPDVLVYATAGGAAQSLKVTEGGQSDRNTLLGWTAGAGTDVKLTEQVFGRVEYRYTDLGKDDFATGSGTREVDSRDHRIQFGLGMKF